MKFHPKSVNKFLSIKSQQTSEISKITGPRTISSSTAAIDFMKGGQLYRLQALFDNHANPQFLFINKDLRFDIGSFPIGISEPSDTLKDAKFAFSKSDATAVASPVAVSLEQALHCVVSLVRQDDAIALGLPFLEDPLEEILSSGDDPQTLLTEWGFAPPLGGTDKELSDARPVVAVLPAVALLPRGSMPPPKLDAHNGESVTAFLRNNGQSLDHSTIVWMKAMSLLAGRTKGFSLHKEPADINKALEELTVKFGALNERIRLLTRPLADESFHGAKVIDGVDQGVRMELLRMYGDQVLPKDAKPKLPFGQHTGEDIVVWDAVQIVVLEAIYGGTVSADGLKTIQKSFLDIDSLQQISNLFHVDNTNGNLRLFFRENSHSYDWSEVVGHSNQGTIMDYVTKESRPRDETGSLSPSSSSPDKKKLHIDTSTESQGEQKVSSPRISSGPGFTDFPTDGSTRAMGRTLPSSLAAPIPATTAFPACKYSVVPMKKPHELKFKSDDFLMKVVAELQKESWQRDTIHYVDRNGEGQTLHRSKYEDKYYVYGDDSFKVLFYKGEDGRLKCESPFNLFGLLVACVQRQRRCDNLDDLSNEVAKRVKAGSSRSMRDLVELWGPHLLEQYDNLPALAQMILQFAVTYGEAHEMSIRSVGSTINLYHRGLVKVTRQEELAAATHIMSVANRSITGTMESTQDRFMKRSVSEQAEL